MNFQLIIVVDGTPVMCLSLWDFVLKSMMLTGILKTHPRQNLGPPIYSI